MRRPVFVTRGMLGALAVSWLAIVAAICWVAVVSSDLSAEKTTRQRQDQAAVVAISTLLRDIVVNTNKLKIKGYQARAAEYQRLLNSIEKAKP